ncbi:MAG: precorrin-6A/cobalt-precorrin-6A reductase [Bacteroidota bacterium]
MILIFGGTTEGKKTAQLLEDMRRPFLYSTKTRVNHSFNIGTSIYGAKDEGEMVSLCENERIRLIIDAAHPFAENLHRTVSDIAHRLNIPSVRYERINEDRVVHPLIHYVSDYQNVLDTLHQLGNPTLLALSGVQSIPKLARYWTQHTTYFRILDRPESLAVATQCHFPLKNLLFGLPPKYAISEIKLIKYLEVAAMLTKESGKSGNQSTKMEAAITTGIPLLILKRPKLPCYKYQVKDSFSLRELVTKLTDS